MAPMSTAACLFLVKEVEGCAFSCCGRWGDGAGDAVNGGSAIGLSIVASEEASNGDRHYHLPETAIVDAGAYASIEGVTEASPVQKGGTPCASALAAVAPASSRSAADKQALGRACLRVCFFGHMAAGASDVNDKLGGVPAATVSRNR